VAEQQFQVIHDVYAKYLIYINLKDITWTTNKAWATETFTMGEVTGPGEPKLSLEMKKSLRKGDYKTLNLYFVTSFAEPLLLGISNLPNAFKEGSVGFFADGPVIDQKTMPGGPRELYNQGSTAVHEIGHWFGLDHPWDDRKPNSCERDGDGIDDTPRTKGNLVDCVPRDSCPDHPGDDPIHNYMTYTPE
jgi:hypothetical protein